MVATPMSTPKRKREQMTIDNFPHRDGSAQFTFAIDHSVSDGSVSPRTSVAHRFQGLALEGGGGVTRYRTGEGASPSLGPTSTKNDIVMVMDIDIDDGAQRKRARLPDFNMPSDTDSIEALEAAGSTDPLWTTSGLELHSSAPFSQTEKPQNASRNATRRQLSPKALRFDLDTAIIKQSETIANTHESKPSVSFGTNDHTCDGATTTIPAEGEDGDAISLPPVAVGQDSPSSTLKHGTRSPKRRAGTPPPSSFLKAKSKSDPESTVTDPVRASLTWHDDEITVYDPDDSDDDGTGINGIGFKPTPAIAYARNLKRKQQLAEYKKREERDARARRSQRRGAGLNGSASGRVSSPARSSVGDVSKGAKTKVERRRVRFLESVVKEAIGV